MAGKMKLRENAQRSEKVAEAMEILKEDVKTEKDDSPTIVATVVKKRRGRPPLNKSSSDKSLVPGSSTSSQGKVRGRPSKYLLNKSSIKKETVELDQNVDSAEKTMDLHTEEDKDHADIIMNIDKSVSTEEPQQKQPESRIRKAGDEDYVPTPTPAKRGRPPSLKPADSSTKNFTENIMLERKSVSVDKDKGGRSFERFYQQTKDSYVVSERWSFGGVLWDPTRKMKVMAVSEVDVASSGNMRLKRCIQVYEDMSVKVLIEGADMTRTFSSGVVENPTDVALLIHNVATSKICSGIKNFGTTDKITFPHCVLRGESYYAPECPVVIDHGAVGPSCSHCNRLTNTIHRRNVKEANLLISKSNRPPVKNGQNKFAKLLYSVLTDLVEASSVDEQKERTKLKRTDVNPFQSDSRGSADRIQGGRRQFKSDPGSEYYRRVGKSYGTQNDVRTINVLSGLRHKTAYKVRGSDRNYSNVPGATRGSLVQNEMQFVLGGHNVIFQNSSGDFTMTEGEEYELIGEADSNNHMQVSEVMMKDEDSNNAIEIIEVDDQTLAQLTSQNMSNIIIQGPPSSFEVQEIDMNDPNFRDLVKAFNPTVLYQS